MEKTASYISVVSWPGPSLKPISEDVFNQMEQAGGVALSSVAQADIQEIVTRAWEIHHFERHAPKAESTEIRKAMEAAHELERFLQSPTGDLCGQQEGPPIDLDELADMLTRFRRKAQKAKTGIEGEPRKKGRKEDTPGLSWFIKSIAEIYEAVGGRASVSYDPVNQQYTGHFLAFLSECVLLIPEDMRLSGGKLGNKARNAVNLPRHPRHKKIY